MTDKKKINCWEVKDCGRTEGGKHAKYMGVCPASTEAKLNGVHGGINAGRSCWVIANTFCHETVQGSVAKKSRKCTACDFYKLVEKEEGEGFLLSTTLLKKMKFGSPH